RTSSTTPPWRAGSSFCIFIASTTATAWPAVTASPGRTRTLTTTPGIGACTVSPAPGPAARWVDCSSFSSGCRTSTGSVVARPDRLGERAAPRRHPHLVGAPVDQQRVHLAVRQPAEVRLELPALEGEPQALALGVELDLRVVVLERHPELHFRTRPAARRRSP